MEGRDVIVFDYLVFDVQIQISVLCHGQNEGIMFRAHSRKIYMSNMMYNIDEPL